jgi:transposase-like protein
MSKLNQLQREQLKRIILDSVLQRLTTAEAQAHVKDKLGVEITIDYLNHVKMELRQYSQKELNHLRKNRLSYMNHLFFERIDEVKNMQRK